MHYSLCTAAISASPRLPSPRRSSALRALSAALCLLLFLPILPLRAATPAKPNVLVIVADDMGFSDAGCYGGEIQTPNLDRLAKGGLRFTQFYNTARCWPSRAAILTGYYAQQVRRDAVPGVLSGARGIRPKWARLLPEMLKPLGYRAYHSGKWHVDGKPLENGFDRSYSLEDHNRYFAPRDHFEDDQKLPPVATSSGYYATTAIANHALKCLKEHAREHAATPFFHYLCFTSPHFPLHAKPEDIDRYRSRYAEGWDAVREQRWKKQRELGIIDCALPNRDERTVPPWNLSETVLQKRLGVGEAGFAVAWSSLSEEQKRFQAAKMSIHAAMVDRMDQEIGRVLDQVRQMGVMDNTVIFFLSDNGASAEQIIRGDEHDLTAPAGSGGTFLCLGPGWSTAANSPLRLHKSWVHEGGISTPLIVHWPQGIAARGELRHNPAHLVDLAPTIVSLAGGQWPAIVQGQPAAPPPPGQSLAPAFARDRTVTREYLWWFHETNRAVRVGDWKGVSAGRNGPWELYDLKTDRCEMNNLAAQHPDKARELEQLWLKIMDEFRTLAQKDLPPAPPRNPARPKAATPPATRPGI